MCITYCRWDIKEFKVQSAHMVTTDYVALSQPLTDGVLLHDRTERKLKLVHSLGELLPRNFQRGAALEWATGCAGLGVGAVAEQQPQHAGAPFVDGEHQRRVALVVRHVRVGARAEEQFDHRHLFLSVW